MKQRGEFQFQSRREDLSTLPEESQELEQQQSSENREFAVPAIDDIVKNIYIGDDLQWQEYKDPIRNNENWQPVIPEV